VLFDVVSFKIGVIFNDGCFLTPEFSAALVAVFLAQATGWPIELENFMLRRSVVFPFALR